MAPQRLEKIESAPGIGMVSEASNPQHLVHGRAADRARLRLTSPNNRTVAKLQKKAPNALKLRDAELKWAPCSAWAKIDPGPRAKRRANVLECILACPGRRVPERRRTC